MLKAFNSLIYRLKYSDYFPINILCSLFIPNFQGEDNRYETKKSGPEGLGFLAVRMTGLEPATSWSRNSGIFALDHTGNEATMLHTLCEPDTAATSEME